MSQLAAAALKLGVSPTTAKQAMYYRLINKLSKQRIPGIPQGEAEKLLLAKSHEERDRDQALSEEEERRRSNMLPMQFGANNITQGSVNGESMFHFRDYPMFPGEYIPAEHNTLASVRDELRADLTAQSIKDAWIRVAGGGGGFDSPTAFFASSEGSLDDVQVGEVVNAMLPSLTADESRALTRRVLEAISSPESTPARQLNSTVSADALGLDDTPGHYTNFMEWMGRLMDSKGFKTEQALYQFSRRRFNRQDVRLMYENYKLFSKEALQVAQSDGYSHLHAILKDYSDKVYSRDSRAIKGVRIDPQEVEEHSGISIGFGSFYKIDVVAWIRENRDGNGKMTAQGKDIRDVCADAAWRLEELLWPFDEASLNVRDFDVYLDTTRNFLAPEIGGEHWCGAARLAVANAISKMLPLTRVALKKAGLLTADKRLPIEDHPGYLSNTKFRPYSKRSSM